MPAIILWSIAPLAVPVLPAVIVSQTLIEPIAQPIYIRVIAKFGHNRPPAA